MRFHVRNSEIAVWPYLKLKSIFSKYPKVCKIILQYHLIEREDLSHWRALRSPGEAIHAIVQKTIDKRNLEAIRELAKAGLDLLAKNDEYTDESPIFWAAESGASEIVRYLLDQGASPNESDITRTTLLHKAVSSGDLETVRILIDRGAELESYENINNRTPLGVAVAEGKMEMVQLLLDAGANAKEEDYLSLAAYSGSIPMFNFFREKADSSEECVYAFQAALAGGNLDMLLYILELTDTPVKEPSLLDVLQTGNTQLFDYLSSPEFAKRLGHQISWDPRTPYAVHAAVDGGSRRLLQWVLEGGGDPNEQPEYSNPPLFHILSHESSLANILLKYGADPNRRNQEGETPLEHALKTEKYSLALQLLGAGAAPLSGKDHENREPLTITKENCPIWPIVQMLAKICAENAQESKEGENESQDPYWMRNPDLLDFFAKAVNIHLHGLQRERLQ
ncbi:MAG: ankyrin repeat domain-containing protein [Planctomycetia bacterium]|nr:ankyrin repeat domain-containing protein [Planctomycetia bacterium]